MCGRSRRAERSDLRGLDAGRQEAVGGPYRRISHVTRPWRYHRLLRKRKCLEGKAAGRRAHRGGCSYGCSSLRSAWSQPGSETQVRTVPDAREPPPCGLIIRRSWARAPPAALLKSPGPVPLSCRYVGVVVILRCHACVQLCAATSGQMQVAVPNTCQSPRSPAGTHRISALPQRFADPALGELVLARDALGVDAQQDVDAVPGPLGYLGWVDAAIQPGGQASMPQVIGPPGQR